jgi:hypothetical protein
MFLKGQAGADREGSNVFLKKEFYLNMLGRFEMRKETAKGVYKDYLKNVGGGGSNSL